MCERCWNNFANEYILYSANAMERKKRIKISKVI